MSMGNVSNHQPLYGYSLPPNVKKVQNSGQQYSMYTVNNVETPTTLKCFADRNLKITASPAALATLDKLGVTFSSRSGGTHVEIYYPDDVSKTDIFNATSSIDCSRYSSLEVTEKNGRVSLTFSGNNGSRTMIFSAISPEEIRLRDKSQLEENTGYTREIKSLMEERGINITSDILEKMQDLRLEFCVQDNDLGIKPRSGYLIQCNEDNTGWQTGAANQVYLAPGLNKVEVSSDGYIKINAQDEQGSYTVTLSAKRDPYSRGL